jgi:hypothetical protein
LGQSRPVDNPRQAGDLQRRGRTQQRHAASEPSEYTAICGVGGCAIAIHAHARVLTIHCGIVAGTALNTMPRRGVVADAPLAPGQSADPYIAQKLTRGCKVENVWSIWFAARDGDIERVETLLARPRGPGIDRQDTEHGRTPLHWACRGRATTMVKLLLERGATVNAVDREGNTPLHYCCAFGSDAMLRISLNSLALDPLVRNNKFKTPAEVSLSTTRA